MISSQTLALDRLATLILGLALLVGGVATVWWWTGESPMLLPTDTSVLQDLVAENWWPLVSAVAGIVLVLFGLRWLLAHLRRRHVGAISLDGSGGDGRLSADGSGIAQAAAEVLRDSYGVRQATSGVRREQGRLVIQLSAVVEPWADLTQVGEAADEVARQLARMIGERGASLRVLLTVASRVPNEARVE